ncbi:MAG: glycosyltransferase 87 family protein [Chloroflexota bacterium]|nr:glycosyltransferase 87 family protein [Chloroflexota bacterium]
MSSEHVHTTISHPGRWLSRILLVGAVAFHLSMLFSWRMGFLNPLFFDSTITHGARGWDFFALYQAGHNFLQGDSVYQSDGDKIDVVVPRYTPFRYLPVSAYTVGVALNILSPLNAFRLWVAFTEALLLFCVYLTWKLVPDRDLFARLAAMLLCFTPFYLELYMGQFSMVQAALLFTMMYFYLRHGKATATFDAPWIVSVLWKQNTGLFAPLMLRLRRFRALAWLAILIALTAIPYFALFPSGIAAFLGNFRAAANTYQMGNLGWLQLIFEVLAVLAPGWSPERVVLVQRASILIFVGLSLALTFLDRDPDVITHLSLWMTTYFLIFHQIWEHHYVMLLPVLVILYACTRSRLILILYALIAFFTPFFFLGWAEPVATSLMLPWTPVRPAWAGLLYHASKPLPTVILYGYLVWQVVRRRDVTKSPQ